MTKVLSLDGLPIIDAKRPLRLTITPDDINKADPKRPGNCAVARACAREFHAVEVRVHLGRVYIRTNEKNWQRYQTPAPMRDEIIAFDRGGTFVPQTFDLFPMRPSKKLGQGHTGGKAQTGKKRRGNKRRSPHILTDVRTGPATQS